MRKLQIAGVLLVGMFTVGNCIAGDEFWGLDASTVGNGGDVVVCRDASQRIKTVELLDYYEARTVRGITPELGGDFIPPMQKVELALSRWESTSPLRVARLRGWANSFMGEAMFLSNVTLVDVPDSQHLAIPNGCTIEQIAIQRTPEFSGDRLYTINKDLWDLLDSTNQAGLILHEVIYREVRANRSNSSSVRYLVGQLTANAPVAPRGTDKALLELHSRMGLEFWEHRGRAISLAKSAVTPQYFESENLKTASLACGLGLKLIVGGREFDHCGLIILFASGEIQYLSAQHPGIFTSHFEFGRAEWRNSYLSQIGFSLAGEVVSIQADPYYYVGKGVWKSTHLGELSVGSVNLEPDGSYRANIRPKYFKDLVVVALTDYNSGIEAKLELNDVELNAKYSGHVSQLTKTVDTGTLVLRMSGGADDSYFLKRATFSEGSNRLRSVVVESVSRFKDREDKVVQVPANAQVWLDENFRLERVGG